MSKRFNKNLALIALTAALAVGGSASLADAAGVHPAKFASSLGWKLPTGTKVFMGTVSAINGLQLTVSHPKATTTPNVLVNTTASTTYLGGAFSNITIGTRISGVGIKQTDGSFTASSVRINPAVKTGIMKRQQNAGIRAFFGTITANSGSSITVNQTRGKASTTALTINLTSSTAYATGTVANLTVGSKVAGIGTLNADKSISALKINPNSNQIGMFYRGGRGMMFGQNGKGNK